MNAPFTRRNFEQAANHLIANGAKIQEQGLGTVLPTAKSLRIGDRVHAREVAGKARIGRTSPALANCERRLVGGEVRYYASESRFAVVGRANVIRWFEIRGGQTFAAH